MDNDATPVVVVGGGGAGMVAAIESARSGVPVVVLEKSVRGGCNTQLSGGLIQASGTPLQRKAGVEDSPELMFQDIVRKNQGHANLDVVAMIAQRSADVIRLFSELGMVFHLDQNVLYFGHSVHRMHAMEGETGAELVDHLRSHISNSRLIDFIDEAEVTDAVRTQDGWSLKILRGGRQPDKLSCRRLILACDGFGADKDMVREFCGDIADATYIGSANNTGDGIRMARSAGAGLQHMGGYQAHAHVNPGFGTRLGGALPSLGAIVVSQEGHRFEREDQGYSEFAKHVLRQSGGVALEVYDASAHEAALAMGSYRDAVDVGAVKTAGSAEELAELFGVDGNALALEMDRYNRQVDGEDWLGRRHSRRPLKPPLYAALITGALAHTQGGISIDSDCRVLAENGGPVPGMFAAGGTAAGISGIADDGYLSGNGLIHAFATGMIASQSAVRELLTEHDEARQSPDHGCV